MRLFIALALIAYSTAVSAQEQRSIKVTAKSEIKVAPDEVVLQLAVHTRDKQLLTAKRENDKIAAAVLALATTHSIPPADVKVTDLDVSPDYGNYAERQSTPVAYDFTRAIKVRLTEFTKIEPFLSDAFDVGLSHVTRLQFRVSNQREHQFEARKLAVTYAREKAEHLTQLTGMKLGSPVRIEEDVEDNWEAGGFGGGAIGAYQPNEKAGNIASKECQFTVVAFQQEAEDTAGALIAPGQIIINAHVTIEFEMSK
ncbi:MAG: SIMPL domain-containing protein [Planctomycetota bacterium]